MPFALTALLAAPRSQCVCARAKIVLSRCRVRSFNVRMRNIIIIIIIVTRSFVARRDSNRIVPCAQNARVLANCLQCSLHRSMIECIMRHKQLAVAPFSDFVATIFKIENVWT